MRGLRQTLQLGPQSELTNTIDKASKASVERSSPAAADHMTHSATHTGQQQHTSVLSSLFNKLFNTSGDQNKQTDRQTKCSRMFQQNNPPGFLASSRTSHFRWIFLNF